MFSAQSVVIAALVSAGAATAVANDPELSAVVLRASATIDAIHALVETQHVQAPTVLFEANTGRMPASDDELAKDGVYLDYAARDRHRPEFAGAVGYLAERHDRGYCRPGRDRRSRHRRHGDPL